MKWGDIKIFYKLIIITILILIAIISLYPFIYLILLSLAKFENSFKIIAWPVNFEIVNYVNVFKKVDLLHFYRNSIIVAIMTVTINILVGAPAAYAFARFKFYFKEVLYVVFLLGVMIPGQAIVIPLFLNLKALNLLNNYLTLGIVYPTIGLAFTIFIMRSFFENLQQDIIDAAIVDGCDQYKIFWKIALPLSRPALVSIVLFQFIWAWDEYLLAFTFLNDESMMTIPAGLAKLQGEYFTDYPVLGAALVLSSLGIIIVFLLTQRHFIKGLTEGAVKG